VVHSPARREASSVSSPAMQRDRGGLIHSSTYDSTRDTASFTKRLYAHDERLRNCSQRCAQLRDTTLYTVRLRLDERHSTHATRQAPSMKQDQEHGLGHEHGPPDRQTPDRTRTGPRRHACPDARASASRRVPSSRLRAAGVLAAPGRPGPRGGRGAGPGGGGAGLAGRAVQTKWPQTALTRTAHAALTRTALGPPCGAAEASSAG
jgi:hypothetical protein